MFYIEYAHTRTQARRSELEKNNGSSTGFCITQDTTAIRVQQNTDSLNIIKSTAFWIKNFFSHNEYYIQTKLVQKCKNKSPNIFLNTNR